MVLRSTVRSSKSRCQNRSQGTVRLGRRWLSSSSPLCTFCELRCNSMWRVLDAFAHWEDALKPSHGLPSHQGMDTLHVTIFSLSHMQLCLFTYRLLNTQVRTDSETICLH